MNLHSTSKSYKKSEASSRWPVVGILGGMGPLAGVDFAEKLVSECAKVNNVKCDQEYVPFILLSLPQVPDRGAAIQRRDAEDPYEAMAAGIKCLVEAGAELIAIPCNTAHHWYGRLSQVASRPILHIVDSAIDAMETMSTVQRVGVIATPATLKLGLYQDRLKKRGYISVVPTDAEVEKHVGQAIVLAKQSRALDAAPMMLEACEALKQRGAEILILGCTELPLIFKHFEKVFPLPVVDSNRALAQACLSFQPETSSSAKPNVPTESGRLNGMAHR
ncbi:amino acid racemase [Labrenzia sp. DG1229]|uniref:aspartate/glutamate racemase family protein n=1 Tax=Labrenzia sp. DG1229 TaxID=681847 RepID=UPI0007C678D8|nr:amino acid racemase [Labrenzia sp. DG1229]